MSFRLNAKFCSPLALIIVVVMVLVSGVLVRKVRAGVARASAVGGVSITTEGLLDAAKIEDRRKLHEERIKAMQPVPAELKPFTKSRKVSLRRLNEAIREHRESEFLPLDDSIRYLAGMQSIQYVFVYPEQHDIVLVGPAEGWKLNEFGSPIGLTTGKPVLLLDDLLVALRSADAARQKGIQCSIDPTPEGLARLQRYVGQLKNIGNPAETMHNIEQILGPQMVTVDGVAVNSHFARVMVAADFRMKRLAMNFDPSPVNGLTSFLQMLKGGGRGMSSMLPRWWLAPKAQSLLISPDGLSFEIQGLSVECHTEEDFVATDGKRKQTGKANPTAQRWANLFTDKYDELATKDVVFGQLRNLMDLALVAALIHRDDLFKKAGFEATYLIEEEPVETFYPPKQVESRVSFLKKGRNFIMSASGGVQLLPAHMIEEAQKTNTLEALRSKAEKNTDSWWWN